MSLHYLVKLEILIGHSLPLGCYRKKLQNLFHLNCLLQWSMPERFKVVCMPCKALYVLLYLFYLCQIWTQLITLQTVGALQEKMCNICITDLNELKERLRTEWANWTCRHCGSRWSIASFVMHVLYTISCNIFHMLLSTGFKSGEFKEHSWDGINSRVDFCNNSTVARAQDEPQSSCWTLFK